MTVTVERASLVAGDSVPGDLWVRNPAGGPLRDVRLHVAAPGFVEVGVEREGRCAFARGEFPLGDVPPGGVARRVLCLRTGGEVVEGDYNLVFTLTYRRPADGGPERAGFVQAVQAVEVGVLGTESVAGVSLRLLALLLPGILFFVGARRMGAAPGASMDKAEVAALGVVLSLLLVTGLDAVSPAGFRRGMSVERLLLLCAAALVLAALVSAGAALLRHLRGRNRVAPDDPPGTVLEKLLRRREPRHSLRVLLKLEKPGRYAPVEVTLAEGGVKLYGSLVGDTTDGGRVLAGWFEVGPLEDSKRQGELERLYAGGRILRLASRLRALEVEPMPAGNIRTGASRTETLDGVRRFAPGEVEAVVPLPPSPNLPGGPLVVRGGSRKRLVPALRPAGE